MQLLRKNTYVMHTWSNSNLPISFTYTFGKLKKILFKMLKKITLIGFTLVFLSNTDAFLTDHLYNALNYANPFYSAPSTALRAVEDRHAEEKTTNFDLNYNLCDIRDGLSLQKAILQIRLKSAKQFVQERTELLKQIIEKKWSINETILTQKRKDLEIAKSDVKILEDALRNPSQFKNLILEQD